jgi:hypothetical protein
MMMQHLATMQLACLTTALLLSPIGSEELLPVDARLIQTQLLQTMPMCWIAISLLRPNVQTRAAMQPRTDVVQVDVLLDVDGSAMPTA